jgi:hypothetical protein
MKATLMPAYLGRPIIESSLLSAASLAGNRGLHDLPHDPNGHAQNTDEECEAAEKAGGAIPPISQHSSAPRGKRSFREGAKAEPGFDRSNRKPIQVCRSVTVGQPDKVALTIDR